MIDFVLMFLGVLFALITKDIYDVFIQKHIKHWLSKSKSVMEMPNKRTYEDDEEEYDDEYEEERR